MLIYAKMSQDRKLNIMQNASTIATTSSRDASFDHSSFMLESATSLEASSDLPASPQSLITVTHLLLAFACGGLVTAALTGSLLFLFWRPEPSPIVLHPPPTAAPTATAQPPVPTATPAPITVFVSGAVYTPGVYELSLNARVGDALQAAGGLTNEANSIIVNQAEKLWDGVQIHVPELAEEVNTTLHTLNALPPQPPTGVSGTPLSAMTDDQQVVQGASGGLINVNTATTAQLESLPGIGPSRAQEIINNRPYATVNDLERVSGIGPKTIEKFSHLVTTE